MKETFKISKGTNDGGPSGQVDRNKEQNVQQQNSQQRSARDDGANNMEADTKQIKASLV